MRSTDGVWFRRVRLRLSLLSAAVVALTAGLVFLLVYAVEVRSASHHICEVFEATGATAFADYHVAQVGRLLAGAWVVLVACAALAGHFLAPFVTRAADEAMENLSRSADAVAHDLKAPLTRLKVRCEMAMAGGAGAESALAAEVAGDIEALLAFINTLLEIARLERAGATREERVEFGRLVQDVEELYRPLAESAGLAFRVARPAAPLVLMAHRGKMMQVVGNLVDNAFKYTPRGGRVDVSVRPEGSSILLSVADTGVGVPAEALPRLFEKFYRGTNADAPGNGLGLALVQAIVTAYGGDIRVAPGADGGSVFTVRLPGGDRAADRRARTGRRG